MFSFELHDGSTCSVIRVRTKDAVEPKDLLNELRRRFPKLVLQIISDNAVYDDEHLKWVARQSWLAKNRAMMFAKKVEIDLLMRIAGVAQIADAVKVAGARKGEPLIILGIGEEGEVNNLRSWVKDKFDIIRSGSAKVIPTQFSVNSNELNAVGGGKEALLLAERGLIAILEKY